MDTKKIIIGLVGGAVAGYVYYEFIAKKKVVKTVSEGVEEVVEEGEEAVEKSFGGGGGGGFVPTTETGATSTETGATSTSNANEPAPQPAIKPTIKPITQVSMPLLEPRPALDSGTYTKPATTTTTTTTYTKPTVGIRPTVSIKEAFMTASKFSGIGGDKWEADIDNLDI